MPNIGGFILKEQDEQIFPICMAYDDSGDKLPSEYTIPFKPPVENQGVVGSCVAHAVANILEVIYYNYVKEHKDFSIGFLYGNRNPNEWQGIGMDGRLVCSHLCNDGDVFASMFESDKEVPKIISEVDAIKDDLIPFAFKTAFYAYSRSFDEVKKFIYKYNIPVMGIVKSSSITGNMYDKDHHAMALRGWTDNGRAVFQNSWGARHENLSIPIDEVVEYWIITPWNFPDFKDVTPDHWAYEDIISCANDKIVAGYVDNTFKPDQNITRAEFCAMLYRELKLKLV